MGRRRPGALVQPGRLPCPIKEEEVNRRKLKRHRKSRMDARTRERLPVLPTLVRTVNEQRRSNRRGPAGSPPNPAWRAVHRAGQTLIRTVTRHGAVGGKVSADDPGTASDATSNAKKTTPSGPGRSLKSCASPAFGSRSCWSSRSTALCNTVCPRPTKSCRCCRSCHRRPMRRDSYWFPGIGGCAPARSSTGSRPHPARSH